MTVTGSCLCGIITFEITTMPGETTPGTFTHCYCKRCRKASGSGRASVLITSAEHLVWTGNIEKLVRWDLPQACSFATSFCTQCGSPMPRLSRNGVYAVVPAGSLDSDVPMTPVCHEHWTSRANWVLLDERHLPIHKHNAP